MSVVHRIDRAGEECIVPVMFPALIKFLGASPAQVLRRAELPADLFTRRSTSISAPQLFALMSALDADVAARGGEPTAVQMARAATLENFDPSIFAFCSSPDIATGFLRMAQFKAVVSAAWTSVESSSDGLTIEFGWPAHLTVPPVVDLAWMLLGVWVARVATKVDVQPTRVVTAHEIADPRAYEDFLGVPITPGESNIIEFSATDASLPLLTANETMWDTFESVLRRRLREIDAGASASERVRSALLELLPAGQDTTQAVARALAVSTRTLQRQLHAEGTSFAAILTRTRQDLARHYLSRGDLVNAEIALLLGYEDPRSFYRAFHSWTGESIHDMRTDRAS